MKSPKKEVKFGEQSSDSVYSADTDELPDDQKPKKTKKSKKKKGKDGKLGSQRNLGGDMDSFMSQFKTDPKNKETGDMDAFMA